MTGIYKQNNKLQSFHNSEAFKNLMYMSQEKVLTGAQGLTCKL